MSKQDWRREMARRVRALDARARVRMDQAVVERVLDLFGRYFHLGATVLAYMPLKDEVDFTPVITECMELDLCLVLPRVVAGGRVQLHRVGDFRAELVRGGLGVMEPRPDAPPVPGSRVDLAFIPGRAFTVRGERLGRGLGCYDRVLETLGCPTVGIAYSCQVVDELPVEAHDRRVDVVVTDQHPDPA